MKTANSHSISAKKMLPWAALVILILGVSIITALYWQQNLRVKWVVVQGNYFTPSEKIVSVAEIELGVHPDSVDLTSVIQKVEALQYVFSAKTYVDALGKLTINTQERFPIALLINGNDEIYVDSYGVKLPIIPGKHRNLPLVYGFDARLNADTLSSKEFIQVRDFLVSALRNEFGWATISEVVYEPSTGVVALSHENGVKLLFGENDFDLKFRNWEAFYGQVVAYKGIQAMQQVDLRFTNQVITNEVDS